MLRLFFALWPDPALRAQLAALAAGLRDRCGGRSPPPANIHLTLAFIGPLAASRLPELTAMASGLQAAPVDLTLDRIGCWRAQRLVWAAPRHCPAALSALVAALRAGLQARGFPVERRTFRPHVTLLRDMVTPPEAGKGLDLNWQARSVVLASSQPAARGVHYRIIGEWPLAGA